jgi:hypothetical protein
LKKGKTTGGNSVPRPAPGDQQGLKLDLQGREAGGSVGLLLPPLGGPAHALIGLLWGFPCTRVRKYKAGRLRLSKQISCQRLLTVAAVPLWRLRRSAHGCRIGQKTRKNDSAWSLGGGKLHKYQRNPMEAFLSLHFSFTCTGSFEELFQVQKLQLEVCCLFGLPASTS